VKHLLRVFVVFLIGCLVAAAAYATVTPAHHHKKPKHHKKHKKKKAKRAPARIDRKLGPELFGFNDNSVLFQQSDPESAIQRSAAVGANVIRYTLNWDYIEATQGQFNWRGYDPLYQAARQHGIRPILIVAFSPGWTRPLDLSCGTTGRAHCHNPPDARFDGAWTNFVTEAVKRYPESAAVEIWNEPNLSNFWKSGPNPTRYAQLLNEAYDAVKNVNPNMPVLGGALANSQFGGNGSTPYERYLNALLDLKPRFDALAIHDYDTAGTDANWFDRTLDIARSALDSHGYPGVPIWVTELGRSTTGPRAVTPVVQATRLLQMLQALDKRPYIKAAVIHTLIPAPTGPTTEEYGFATVDANGTPKPAYCVLSAARRVARPAGC
jgi:hypothetical protein